MDTCSYCGRKIQVEKEVDSLVVCEPCAPIVEQLLADWETELVDVEV